MKFKVAYTTNKDNIQKAIDQGSVDAGDMVIVDNGDNKNGELVFIRENKGQIAISGGPTDVVRYGDQKLEPAEQQQARENIGAGTSNFSGDYKDLSNVPKNLATTNYVDTKIGEINTALQSLSDYAQNIIQNGIVEDGGEE